MQGPMLRSADPRVKERRAIRVRRPRFAFSSRTPRHWFAGDPFKTHFMNALSSSLPQGEAFFIRSVSHFRDRIRDPELCDAIRAFCGQEAIHSREHGRHIELLAAQGYPGLGRLGERVERRLQGWNRRAPVWSIAMTAAAEHLTTIMARRGLADPAHWTAPMHEDMAPLWCWHGVEELEHKAVAFDVFQDVSGSHPLRVAALPLATLGFLGTTSVRLLYLLARDGEVWKPRTWIDGARFLWGREGILRALAPDYLRWFRRDFHPSQHDDRPLIDAHLRGLP